MMVNIKAIDDKMLEKTMEVATCCQASRISSFHSHLKSPAKELRHPEQHKMEIKPRTLKPISWFTTVKDKIMAIKK